MKALQYIEDFLYKSPRWKLVFVVLGIMLLKTGIWAMPNLFVSQSIAQDPYTNPFRDPMYDYMCWSWLAPYLAWVIGATGTNSFFLFHLFFSMSFTALFLSLIFKVLPDRESRTSLVIFAALPVSATAYYWVGMDSLTLFLMALALWTRKVPVLALLVGIGIGMQHFEQGFVGAGAILVALFLGRVFDEESEYPLKWAAFLLAGVIVGKITLGCIFQNYGVQVNAGRAYYLLQTWPVFLTNFLTKPHVMLWSVLGLGWVAALKYAEKGRRSFVFFIPLAFLLLLLPISDDETRVLANTSFMLVSVCWLLNGKFIAQISGQIASWILLLWVLVPWSWVWQGRSMWSAFPYDMIYLFQKMLGLFPKVPVDYFLPFR